MTERNSRPPSFARGLSARLLALTILFVMLAELLIYTPSIARYRKIYLEEHIAKAQIAALAVEAAPDMRLGSDLEMELLMYSGAYGIMLRKADHKVLALRGDMPPTVDVTFDLREGNFMVWIEDAFEALLQDRNRVMRVIGVSPMNPTVMVEVVMDEQSMREEMIAFSERILQLSIVISLITAGLLYLSLQLLMVRPMRRITESMVSFRDNPEHATGMQPSSRVDEIGVAQRELAVMQHELRMALQQKNRLAALGAAVTKINHDLRNSLATAVLVSDRLAHIEDPEVQRMTPRLFDAIDRAIGLCSQTLMYARDPQSTLNSTRFHLAELVDEVGGALIDAAPAGVGLDWQNAISPVLEVEADRDQLFRVLENLAKNAAEAGAARVRIEARVTAGGHIHIDVADDGPGLAPRAREHLFEPFAGSARNGGTGLGLVIARDIMSAHGGALTLVESGAAGTTFRLVLPARAGTRAAAE